MKGFESQQPRKRTSVPSTNVGGKEEFVGKAGFFPNVYIALFIQLPVTAEREFYP
jgi:hypothetical protein